MKILSNEQIDQVVERAFKEDYLLEHYVTNRGQWERIAPFIAQAQLKEDKKQVVKWGNELCQSGSHNENDMWPIPKHDCSECWQDLEKEGKK